MMNQSNKSAPDSEQTELPLPEDHFRKRGIASRPTFYRWEKLGLRVLRVGGRRFIYPSELRDFLEQQNLNNLHRELANQLMEATNELEVPNE